MVLKRGYVTLLYTVRYGSHAVYRENYAVLAVRCKFQDSVFLPLTVRCDTVRYGNLLQYYNTGLRRLSPPRGAGWEPGDTLRGVRRAKKSHLVGAVATGTPS